MESRVPLVSLVFAALAVIISLSSFFYSVYKAEIGLMIGDEDYDIELKNKLLVANTYNTLAIKLDTVVRNNGTLPLRINKASALLQLGPENHLFSSDFTKNMVPQSIWNGDVNLVEDIVDGKKTIRDDLHREIINYMLDQYHMLNDCDSQIQLDAALLNRIGQNLEDNTSWMEQDKDYYFLVLFWVNKDKHTPSIKRLFKFEFTTRDKQGLTKYQKKAYLTPKFNFVPANKFVQLTVTKTLKPIKNNKIIQRKYSDDYLRLAND